MNPMNAPQILTALGKALSADEAITQYCQNEFGKDRKVYLGIDNLDPPPADEYPLIVVYYVERFRGEGASRIRYAAEIGVGVHNKDIAHVEGSNLHEYTGLRQAEELRELVEDAVLRTRLGKIDVAGDTRSEAYYPVFRANTLIVLETIRSSRGPAVR